MIRGKTERVKFREFQRKRVNEGQAKIAKDLGFPKGFFQFAKRHGVFPVDVQNEYLKYPS